MLNRETLTKHLTYHRVAITRLAIAINLIAFAFILNLHLVSAQLLAGQAFGLAPVSQVRGTRAYISANQVPAGHYGIAGLTGICTTVGCSESSSGYWETGWGKGTLTSNALTMFVGYKKPYQSYTAVYNLAPLQGGTSYRYQTLYSNSEQRWEAWLGLTPKYYRSDMGFTSGNRVVCGGETLKATSQSPNPPLSDGCTEASYKTVTNNQWVLHSFPQSQMFGPYCINTQYPTTVYFYGPC